MTLVQMQRTLPLRRVSKGYGGGITLNPALSMRLETLPRDSTNRCFTNITHFPVQSKGANISIWFALHSVTGTHTIYTTGDADSVTCWTEVTDGGLFMIYSAVNPSTSTTMFFRNGPLASVSTDTLYNLRVYDNRVFLNGTQVLNVGSNNVSILSHNYMTIGACRRPGALNDQGGGFYTLSGVTSYLNHASMTVFELAGLGRVDNVQANWVMTDAQMNKVYNQGRGCQLEGMSLGQRAISLFRFGSDRYNAGSNTFFSMLNTVRGRNNRLVLNRSDADYSAGSQTFRSRCGKTII